MALHTVGVVVRVVVHHTVTHDLLFAYTALLLTSLVTFCTVSVVIFRKEFAIQFFLAAVTSEAILVKNFTKSCAAIVS